MSIVLASKAASIFSPTMSRVSSAEFTPPLAIFQSRISITLLHSMANMRAGTVDKKHLAVSCTADAVWANSVVAKWLLSELRFGRPKLSYVWCSALNARSGWVALPIQLPSRTSKRLTETLVTSAALSIRS